MKRGITALATMILLLGGAGPARATLVQILSPAGLSGTDSTTPAYPGSDGSSFANGSTLTVAGVNVTFTDANSQPILRTDQGTSWFGAYPSGTHLIQNLLPGNVGNNAGGTAGGAVTIAFSSPVSEFGLSVQQDHGDIGTTTTFSFTVFTTSGSTPFTLAPADNFTNALSFIGGKDSGGSGVITKVVISSTDSSDSSYNTDFVLGPVTFGLPQVVTAVPEPATLGPCVLTVVGLFVVRAVRRRQRTVAERGWGQT
jgi:hypothetical protein